MQHSRIEECDLVLELALLGDDDGWPTPLEARTHALPNASHPFVCATASRDVATAIGRIERDVGPGHDRLLVSLHLRRARVVDARHVTHLRVGAIMNDDATSHGLLERLGHADVALVYLPGGAAVVFVRAVGKTLVVRSTERVEVAPAGSRIRRLLQPQGLQALAWALVAAAALAFFGLDGPIEALGHKIDFDRLAGADVRMPVWSLVAVLVVAIGSVMALRRPRRARSVKVSRLPDGRALETDEHDRESLLPR